MTATFVTEPVAKLRHECTARSSIHCAGLICPGEEYRRDTLAPWAFDELELVGVDENGEPIVAVARAGRHPDGGRRGWRHELVCAACRRDDSEAAA